MESASDSRDLAAHAYNQRQSHACMSPCLLTLPVELRSMILESFFRTITIRHGFESARTMNTSILRTCRLLYAEAVPLLAPNIAFHFRSPTVMLDTFIPLPRETLEKIRIVRLKSYPFPVYPRLSYDYYTTYNMSETLSLLPGLQLDSLTVEDCFHDCILNFGGWEDVGTYHDISSLLLSDGWKELRYITPSTRFMTGHRDSNTVRQRQPKHWDQELKVSDGKASAHVKMYIAVAIELKGLAEHPLTRTEWDTVPGHVFEQPDDFEEGREVLIHARRGDGVSYVQDGVNMDEDLRSLFDRMTWDELKASDRLLDGESDPSGHL